MRTSHDAELLLNAQRGLLGEIPPRLRAVSFDLSADGQDLVARFEFDGEPTDEELECASVAMTNILASYSTNHRSYKEEMVSNPFPNKPQLLRLVLFFGTKMSGILGVRLLTGRWTTTLRAVQLSRYAE